ncbi:MAG TPA: GntR family transcriptional regulator [Burkholderiaceae bacterium]|nr:GntR family transcriptional regulator [Burkholderiaceae bacterium]
MSLDATAENPTPTAADAVFFGIFNGVESQTFVPTQRLVESDLAAQFGVGRNSVREALQRLAAEGLVDLHRFRGASIRFLSSEETGHVLDVAESMTALLARTAARSSTPGNATPLKVALQDLVAAHKADDSALFGVARRRFYRGLLDIGGNQELRRLFPTIQMPIVYAQYRIPGLRAMRVTDYRQIGERVLAGDIRGAESAGRAHVRHVRAAIERVSI